LSDDPQTVSYPLPLILDRIQTSVDNLGRDMNGRLDRIEGQLAQKADLAALTSVDGRVKALEVERAQREKAREVNAEHRNKSVDSRRATWAMAVAAVAAAGAVTEAIVQAIHH
jgi:hypothetical protein